ncbi:glycosyltransferase family 1 protein [Myriangium duriaei CBS 260.36]|uniref:UDP-N-acetylglucosamine transferase subunit ALG13 n=1 Tax=Myriangium duriaei CBS 260.36 TaxID=1168546 RepID=A0A9P4IZD5_9PEZI|nr:glycosyltransferase family 1 protein [Myriangium duriaei CBS 260.36]
MGSHQAPAEQRKRKTCFVTIGATTGFQTLMAAVMTPEFIMALAKHRYSHLILQHGADGHEQFKLAEETTGRIMSTFTDSNAAAAWNSINITGFGMDPAGLDSYFKLAKGLASKDDEEGLVISHAGSGTILAAMRMAMPLVVVPNELLLDNHQVELAEELASQGYVVHGRVNELPAAIDKTEKLRKQLHGWPPVNSGASARSGGGIQAVMDEEMGFLD